MVDRIFQRVMRVIETVLALAFIFAVCLNFANVVGRYGFGRMFMGSDEVQVYIMIAMTFLGAAAVTWRRQHLRMDILVRGLPAPLRALRLWTELVLLAVISGFMLVESASYTLRMFSLGLKSNTADIPLWIPHGLVALGFGLIALVALWRGVQAIRRGGIAEEAPANPAAGSGVES